MPGMNQTGPNGAGPNTGGGHDVCCGEASENSFFGRGSRHPRGGGYGCHSRMVGFRPSLTSEDRREALQTHAERLKNRLDFIQKELDNGVTAFETNDVSES
jgi:hypothetical protein